MSKRTGNMKKCPQGIDPVTWKNWHHLLDKNTAVWLANYHGLHLDKKSRTNAILALIEAHIPLYTRDTLALITEPARTLHDPVIAARTAAWDHINGPHLAAAVWMYARDVVLPATQIAFDAD